MNRLKSRSTLPNQLMLAQGRQIGQIEPIFEFHGPMPTGITVWMMKRVFVNSLVGLTTCRLPLGNFTLAR